MSLYDFETQTHGKWILAGEHAVLRGHPALVFPILGRTLTLRYRKDEKALTLRHAGETGEVMSCLFWRLIDHIKAMLTHANPVPLTGSLELLSDIPIGRGMGASAALSVAVARWVAFQGYLTEPVPSFAKKLENLFHGQSSGLDIVGVAADKGHTFKEGYAQALEQRWYPRWFLSFSGEDGMTSQCIEHVKNLWEDNAVEAQAIDNTMKKSVVAAKDALASDSADALNTLVEAIEEAASCFRRWGLVNESLDKHMLDLKKRGAIAAKPTGSGGGGYVLSLWPTERSKTHFAALGDDLIAV